MNRIQRIAAAAAVSTAVLAPASATAGAEPYPWHENPGAAQPTAPAKPKAQIEHEEQFRLEAEQGKQSETVNKGVEASTPDTTGFPLNTVGLAALGATALVATGAVVVIRRSHRLPKPA